jgi:PAS domain S-box-containing protein
MVPYKGVLGGFNTIRGRLFFILAIVLVPSLVVHALVYRDSYEARSDEELRTNLEIARGTSTSFREFVADVYHQELVLGLMVAQDRLSAESKRNILELSAKEHPSVLSFAWIDPQGRISLSSSPVEEGVDLGSQPFFDHLCPGGPHVSNLFRLPGGDLPVFTISRPFTGDNGSFMGCISAVVEADLIHTALGYKLEGGGTIALVDRAGRLVTRFPQRRTVSWSDRDLSAIPFVKEALGGRRDFVERGGDFQGRSSIHAIVPIDPINWFVIASRPESEFAAAVKSRVFKYTGLFLAVILASIPLAGLMARTISSPVRKLRERTTQGAFDETLEYDIGGPIEIRELAAALQRATANLLESEKRFKVIFNSTAEAIYVHDLEGRMLDVNQKALEVLGYKKDELLRMTPGQLDTSPESIPGRFETLLRDGSITLDTELLDKSGARIQVEINAQLIDYGGRQAVLGVARDITNRKQVEHGLRSMANELERRVKERTLELEQANRAKDDFLANMSHEIRTPLAGVFGMTDVLLEQDLPQGVREDLGAIRNSAGTVLSLLHDLLDLSRIERGKLELFERTFSMRQMLKDIACTYERLSAEKGLTLGLLVHPDVPATLQGDPERIGQVLKNLLSNAVKFTDRGSITMEVQLVGQTEQMVLLKFSVTDTGIGIPQDKHELVFQPFTQIDPTYSKRFAGAGLGLAISRQLVELMGGSISVLSKEGEGATFFFVINLKKAESEMTPLPSDRLRLSDLPPMDLLLAEDNPVNRTFLVRALNRAGHRVSAAENGYEVLEMNVTNRFDLILMDIQMPGMDGLEAARRIRAGGHGRADVPILALTAYAMKGDKEKFLAEGMDGYVTKPVNFGELAETMASACGLKPITS